MTSTIDVMPAYQYYLRSKIYTSESATDCAAARVRDGDSGVRRVSSSAPSAIILIFPVLGDLVELAGGDVSNCAIASDGDDGDCDGDSIAMGDDNDDDDDDARSGLMCSDEGDVFNEMLGLTPIALALVVAHSADVLY
jgi:hypothetical protein